MPGPNAAPKARLHSHSSQIQFSSSHCLRCLRRRFKVYRYYICASRLDFSLIECRQFHILCKSTASRNPISRRTNKQITMAPEEAEAELRKMLADQLLPLQGDGNALFEKFREIASMRSDCGSFQAGGDLGQFGRGQMQAPFEEVRKIVGECARRVRKKKAYKAGSVASLAYANDGCTVSFATFLRSLAGFIRARGGGDDTGAGADGQRVAFAHAHRVE